MRLNDLIAHFDLSQSAMSRMIMRMEDKLCGVIERHSCQDDKRGIYIDLTQSGEKKLQRSKVVFEKSWRKCWTNDVFTCFLLDSFVI